MAKRQRKKKNANRGKKVRGGKRVAERTATTVAAKAPEPPLEVVEETPALMPSAPVVIDKLPPHLTETPAEKKKREYLENMAKGRVAAKKRREIIEINACQPAVEPPAVILLPETVELPDERKKRVFIERMAAGKEKKRLERDGRLSGGRDHRNSNEYAYLKNLTTRHRKMARYKYANPNTTLAELAEKFEYSVGYITSHVISSKLWKNYMQDLDEFDAYETGILKNSLLSMGHKAVAVLEDDLDAKIDGFKDRIVRQNAAKDILNRIDVVGEKDKVAPEMAKVVNLTQVNIKNLSIAEKHDLAARLMSQPVDM